MINCFNVLKELDFEHLAGSQEEASARKIIKKYLDEEKVSYEEQAFTMHGFDSGSGEIVADGKSFNVLPFGLVETQSISGELCIIDNLNVIRFNKGAFRGKIIMSPGSNRDAMDAMLKDGVKAFISISAPHKEASNLSHRQKSVETGIFPAATIKYDDAVKLIEHNGSEITLNITQVREERTAYNIVATVGEATIDENITYLTAHYDTVARSHGSSDNGAGSVVILKIAQYFAKNNPGRVLKVIFCSGEEMGLLGSSAYVEQNLEEIKEKGSFVVNVDVAGDFFGRDGMLVIGTPDLKGYLAGITKEEGYCFYDSLNIYSSDAMPFAVYEIPSVNLARFGGNASTLIHTDKDVIENISADNLDFYFDATKVILSRVLNSKIWPIHKMIDASLRGKIEKYMWGSRREKPALVWKPGYQR